jgi:hypothetical protein
VHILMVRKDVMLCIVYEGDVDILRVLKDVMFVVCVCRVTWLY